MSKVCVFDHPLIQHKLSILRDENTSVKEFRELVSEIAMLMCYEATRDLPLEEVDVKTPVAVAKCKRISGKKLAIVPILRAGLGMVDGMVSMMPNVKVGHIGLFRRGTEQEHRVICRLLHAGDGRFMQHAVNEIADGRLVHGKAVGTSLKGELRPGNAIGRQQDRNAP